MATWRVGAAAPLPRKLVGRRRDAARRAAYGAVALAGFLAALAGPSVFCQDGAVPLARDVSRVAIDADVAVDFWTGRTGGCTTWAGGLLLAADAKRSDGESGERKRKRKGKGKGTKSKKQTKGKGKRRGGTSGARFADDVNMNQRDANGRRIFPEDMEAFHREGRRRQREMQEQGIPIEDAVDDGVPIRDPTTGTFASELFGDASKLEASLRGLREDALTPAEEAATMMDEGKPLPPGTFNASEPCVGCMTLVETFADRWLALLTEYVTGKGANPDELDEFNRVSLDPEDFEERTADICDPSSLEEYRPFVREMCPDVLQNKASRKVLVAEFANKYNDAIELEDVKKRVCHSKLKLCRRRDLMLGVGTSRCSMCRAIMRDASYLARRYKDPGYLFSDTVLETLCSKMDFRYPDINANHERLQKFCEEITEEYEDELMALIDKFGRKKGPGGLLPWASLASQFCEGEAGLCESELDGGDVDDLGDVDVHISDLEL